MSRSRGIAPWDDIVRSRMLPTSPIKGRRTDGTAMFIHSNIASVKWRGGFPGIFGAIGRVTWLQRRDVRDAIALFGLVLVTFAFSAIYDLPLKMFNFAT